MQSGPQKKSQVGAHNAERLKAKTNLQARWEEKGKRGGVKVESEGSAPLQPLSPRSLPLNDQSSATKKRKKKGKNRGGRGGRFAFVAARKAVSAARRGKGAGHVAERRIGRVRVTKKRKGGKEEGNKKTPAHWKGGVKLGPSWSPHRKHKPLHMVFFRLPKEERGEGRGTGGKGIDG